MDDRYVSKTADGLFVMQLNKLDDTYAIMYFTDYPDDDDAREAIGRVFQLKPVPFADTWSMRFHSYV